MFKIQGHGLFEYFKLCGIAKKVMDGKVPKGVTQDTIFEALRITRPKNGFEMFGILKAAVHGPDGVLKRDLGIVSVKKVTAQFAKHIVDATCMDTGQGRASAREPSSAA